MKKLIISTLSAIMLMPMAATAQDDMYFVPTKDNVKKASQKYGMPKDTYYCGSNRDVDEYNRRLRSTVEVIDGDTIATDIISFDPVNGEYPDTLATMQQEDYKCTRSMSRWDDYEVSNAYWHGYTDGRFNRWYGWSTFYDPWYYSSWYGWYDPWLYSSWYGGWYGPWHGGWYGGWYGWDDPWYYGYWGGYYPHHHVVIGGGGSHDMASSSFRSRGTSRQSFGSLSNGSNRLSGSTSIASRGSSRAFSSDISTRDRINNGARNAGRATSSVNRWYDRQNATNNSSRNNTTTRTFDSNRSSGSFNSHSSFGGSRSGGSFGGGSMGGSRGGGFSGGGARNGGRR